MQRATWKSQLDGEPPFPSFPRNFLTRMTQIAHSHVTMSRSSGAGGGTVVAHPAPQPHVSKSLNHGLFCTAVYPRTTNVQIATGQIHQRPWMHSSISRQPLERHSRCCLRGCFSMASMASASMIRLLAETGHFESSHNEIYLQHLG